MELQLQTFDLYTTLCEFFYYISKSISVQKKKTTLTLYW